MTNGQITKFPQAVIEVKVVIIGAGFGGLATAIRLKEKGYKDFLILERENEVGGVWRDNRYPGCACDVQSHLYSLSFAPNPNWSHKFSGQKEIHEYLIDCVEHFNLAHHIKLNQEVIHMEWRASHSVWEISTKDTCFQAQFVVGAFGALSDPVLPKLKGLDFYKGDSFHSAKWPETINLEGKRVGVIGTGASAIQLIPCIQPEVKELHIFQRTPAWVVEREDAPIGENWKSLYSQFPALQKALRLKLFIQRELMVLGFRNPKIMRRTQKEALEHLYNSIEDPDLRAKLTPNYTLGCKRILLSNTYYPALSKSNVHLHTDRIQEIKETAIIEQSGEKTELDILIFCTGFKVTNHPFTERIIGKEGKSLAETWNGNPKAYLGTTVAGFPNFFILQGPNTGLGHSSVILMIESQVNHILRIINYMKKRDLRTVEPDPQAQKRFAEETGKRMEGTVWTSGGCQSWYLDESGNNSTLWPGFILTFRNLTKKVISTDFVWG